MGTDRLSLRHFLAASPVDPDREKLGVISAKADEPLFVVAGPGTGKTACLALRILKLVMVDGVNPAGIIATTFTRKAAAELRSRVLGWGYQIAENLAVSPGVSAAVRARISAIDFNQIYSGTIDSLCDRMLSEFRPPGEESFAPADDFVSRTALTQLMLEKGLHIDADLDRELKLLSGSAGGFGWNLEKKVRLILAIGDRAAGDQVDLERFERESARDRRAGRRKLVAVIHDHFDMLERSGRLDYASAAETALDRLARGTMTRFSESIEAVLVDEYQDTNLLQELLYFELARSSRGNLMVVGDDDQSMYRFRGATVELFSDFPRRYKKQFKRAPQTHFLTTNYRSTQSLVHFVNRFATLDREFQSVRVSGKPRLHAASAAKGIPVLGMFRPTREALAADLADFVRGALSPRGLRLPSGDILKRSAQGAPGDIVLLCASPREYNGSNQPRLPLLLRSELATGSKAIEVFNPRGQSLADYQVVKLLTGLLLRCIDPGSSVLNAEWKRNEVQDRLREIDECAADFLRTAPSECRSFVASWAARRTRHGKWPASTTLLELVYSLASMIAEDAMDNPDSQVLLETFVRQIDAASQLSGFEGRIVHDPTAAPDRFGRTVNWYSARDAIRYVVLPIVAGTAEINEDLIESFPRDRLSIMSIHQSKGLEFPVTIVDIGSDFKTDHASQRPKRFPADGAEQHYLEDALREYSPLSPSRRSPTDRNFDDLYRQYFVAVSRPQDVLLLVGLDGARPDGSIPNVASGMDRLGARHLRPSRDFVEI